MSESKKIQDVNIELGDDVSRMMYEASKLTYANRPGLVNEGHESFSGFRAMSIKYFGKYAYNLVFNLGFDGIGTKVEVSERLDDHSGVAYDLFAMVCDDAVVRGAESIAIGSILDVNHLNNDSHTRESVRQLSTGYVNAARDAGVVVVNGEVAELGDRIGGYGDFNYNWGATAFWVAHEERILTGHKIQPGDKLIGLAEHGFRSNGITDVRKAMLEQYGPNWHNETIKELGNVSLGRLVQRPSTIYSKFICNLTGGYDIEKTPKAEIHGVAHITGGGQPSKLGRMLEPSGFGAVIDNPIVPPDIMLKVQEIRGFSDEKAYGKWHMGSGMVIVTPDSEKVIAEAKDYGIDAQVIGFIAEKPGILIKNCGINQQQEYLQF